MKRPTLSRGYTQFGAQMGRYVCLDNRAEPVKFYLYAMPMSPCGCYDSGGAYWGCGSHAIGWMYHAYADTAEGRQEVFVRATCRERAKDAVLKVFRNAKFYR